MVASEGNWIVAVSKNHYPLVTEFDNYEAALETYESYRDRMGKDEIVYLCPIKMMAEMGITEKEF